MKNDVAKIYKIAITINKLAKANSLKYVCSNGKLCQIIKLYEI